MPRKLPTFFFFLGSCLSLAVAAFVFPPSAAGEPGGPREAPAEIRRKSILLPAKPAVPPRQPILAAPAAPVVPAPGAPTPQPVKAVEGAARLGAAPGSPSASAARSAVPEKAAAEDAADGGGREDAPSRAPAEQGESGEEHGLEIPGAAPASLSAAELKMQRRGIVRAEVRPARPYLLSLPFAGALVSVEAHDGELVEKDRVLAVLDKQAAERDLEEARQAVAGALERVQSMGEYSPGERENAREVLARNADKLREAEERLAMTSMKAPFAGRITEVRARAGQRLKRGDVVLELAEQGDLEVVCQVPSSWVSRLQPGNVIWVYVEETGKSYEAEFARFGGKVNAATRSIRAYARFPDAPADLLPGMSGRADFFPRTGK